MNKKKIAIFTLISLILSTFSGCNALEANLQLAKKITPTNENTAIPYYSVTNANAFHEENPFYELDIRIPKITYSNEDSDTLIDPINKEIYENVTILIEEAKKNAYDTFEKYVDSAVTNLTEDREKKIDVLKNKYKNIIGSDEVKAIAHVLNSKVEINDIASESEVEINNVTSESEVEAFTDSEGLIIPGLHNKNIIIVETTENNNIKETTMSIEGRPGKKKNLAPAEFEENKSTISQMPEVTFAKSTDSEFDNVTQNENNYTKKPENKIDNYDKMPKDVYSGHDEFDKISKDEISSPSFIQKFPRFEGKPFVDDIRRFNTASDSDIITDEISIENFYKELRRIERIRIPSKRELMRQFTRTHIDCSWDVKCLDSEYLSLLIDINESRAQASSKRYYYNIDLKNKKLVKLSDILGEKYKEICIEAINKEIETWDDNKKSALKSNYNIDTFINENTSFFINNNHIPVVVMDKYMITAGAVGYPEFQIIK